MSDYIPQDFWPEILKWLPVKSLGRFRCVCRSWNTLISSSSFIAHHLACSTTKPRLLAGYYGMQGPMGHLLLDPEMLDEFAETLIRPFLIRTISGKYLWYCGVVGSVNGLICLSRNGFYPGIVLWNPLIHKYIPLPSNELSLVHSYHQNLLVGFGYKVSEDDFRVVRVSRVTLFDLDVNEDEDEDEYEDEDDHALEVVVRAEICSARQRIWRILPADIQKYRIVENPLAQCLINGAVHWVVYEYDADGMNSNMMLLFDFEQEEFSTMDLPENLAKVLPEDLSVTVHRGMLGVLHCSWSYCNIWSMTEYSKLSSWSYIISVKANTLTRELKERVLGLTNDGQVVILGSDDQLFLHNSTRLTCRRFALEHKIRKIYACDFIESLIFMDNESGAVSLP